LYFANLLIKIKENETVATRSYERIQMEDLEAHLDVLKGELNLNRKTLEEMREIAYSSGQDQRVIEVIKGTMILLRHF